MSVLKKLINPNRRTVITGDFNFDYLKEKDNVVRVTLESHGFKQLVTKPTTIRGNCIDHAYITEKHMEGKFLLKLLLWFLTLHFKRKPFL